MYLDVFYNISKICFSNCIIFCGATSFFAEISGLGKVAHPGKIWAKLSTFVICLASVQPLKKDLLHAHRGKVDGHEDSIQPLERPLTIRSILLNDSLVLAGTFENNGLIILAEK